MQATEQFRMRMYPDAKQMLSFIASQERRTKSNVVDVLIREKYETLKAKKKSKSTNSSPTREPQP